MKYENEIAQAAYVAGNLAATIRVALESDGGRAAIVDAWITLEADEETNAIASLRSTLSRESKKLYGHGLTVKNGELTKVAARNKARKGKSEFMALCQNFESVADQKHLVAMMETMKAAIASLENQ